MHKIVIKILEGSVVNTNRISWSKDISSSGEFPIAYMCQMPKIMKIG